MQNNLTWTQVLGQERTKLYFVNLLKEISDQRQRGVVIYPPQQDIFNAFKYTFFEHVKIVILGQDPYHSVRQANGLSFSVNQGIKIPPSLSNIYKELSQDIVGFQMPTSGDLTKWALQGVLLLNNTLTVIENSPQSHQNLGWDIFTDVVIEKLNFYKENLVFLLWGSFAKKKCQKINRKKHLILESSHPSPLSAHKGFLGCKHFSKSNNYLINHGIEPINWQI